MPEMTISSAQLREALALPPEASDEDVLRQAAGLVSSIRMLRKKVYVGLIDPILRANGVEL